MDFGTMTSKLRQSIGNPSTGDVTDATLQELINDAYVEIGDKFRFFKGRKVCTFPTVDGVSAYSLPSTSVELIRVYDTTNKVKIELMSDSEAQIYRLDESDTATYGKPKYYTHYRDWIRFIPVPNDVFTMEIYYRIVMTQLVASADVPVFPEAWHTGIVRLSRYNYFEFIANDPPKAINAMNSYKMWLQDKPDEVAQELMHLDRGVVIPTLSENTGVERLDFSYGE